MTDKTELLERKRVAEQSLRQLDVKITALDKEIKDRREKFHITVPTGEVKRQGDVVIQHLSDEAFALKLRRFARIGQLKEINEILQENHNSNTRAIASGDTCVFR